MLLVVALVLVVAAVPLWGGRWSALAQIRVRHVWLVPAAFGLQFLIMAVLEFDSPLVAPALHLVTYALAGAFVVVNRSIRWLWVVGLGWACNTLVIAANDGVMPTSASAARTLGRDRSERFENSAVLDDPRLMFLGDVLVTPSWLPFRNAYSIGDVLLVIGFALLVWSASRHPSGDSGLQLASPVASAAAQNREPRGGDGAQVSPYSVGVDASDWDARYAGADLVWSADANRFVVEVIEGWTPGRAIDIACGEGRNAIWLAKQGWSVTAADFSQVAIDRGARLAADQGVEIEWRRADATAHRLEPASVDLALVCYLQLPETELDAALRNARAGLAPGGAVVVIAHARENLEHGVGGPQDPAVLPTVEQVLRSLDGLTIERAGNVTRPVETDDGVRDAIDLVVVARA